MEAAGIWKWREKPVLSSHAGTTLGLSLHHTILGLPLICSFFTHPPSPLAYSRCFRTLIILMFYNDVVGAGPLSPFTKVIESRMRSGLLTSVS